MFRNVGPEQVRNKFGPRYLSGFYFDWRNKRKRQIPVFAGGLIVDINAQLLSLFSAIKQYIAHNSGGSFQASVTSHILVPLIMLSNGEGRDIHRFLETMHLQSREEWEFYEGLLDLFWPHFADTGYRTNLQDLQISAVRSHPLSSVYVRLDGSDYASQILKRGLGKLYTEQHPLETVPTPEESQAEIERLARLVADQQGQIENLRAEIAGLRQSAQATSRRRRTTFSAEKRLSMVQDYFYLHRGSEFTVRDILQNIYPEESENQVPPSYATIYRDLETLVKQSVLAKENKLDPRNKRYKNFYRLSKIESTLADIEEGSPGEIDTQDMSAPAIEMPRDGAGMIMFRQAGGSIPLAVAASSTDMTHLGGIDFRRLAVLVKEGIRLQRQQVYDEDFKKLEDEIEQGINTGILPDGCILKKWYGLAQLCRNPEIALSRVRKCITEVLKQQEKMAIATDPVVKNLLVLLASVRAVNNSP
jgi:hypothetical protein